MSDCILIDPSLDELTLVEPKVTKSSTVTNQEKILSKQVGKKTTFDGIVIKANKDGNLVVTINGVNCNMLRQDISPVVQEDGKVHKNKAYMLVGKTIKCRVKEIVDGTIYVERKTVINEYRKLLEENLKVGLKIKCVVTSTNQSSGVFVDVGGDYSGLIPIKYLEHIYVSNAEDFVKVGDTVWAIVLDITKNADGSIKDIILNRKATLPTINELKTEYSEGDILMSTVKSISPSGIYVHLGQHLDMLCPVIDGVRFEKGEQVKVRINRISHKIDGEII